MYIVYLVYRADFLTGGMRVIFEHVNRLATRGHQVEVWTIEPQLQAWFDCRVSVVDIKDTEGKTPDILVATDATYVEQAIRETPAKKIFFLAQHDLALIAESRRDAVLAETLTGIFERTVSQCHIIAVSHWVQEAFQRRYGLDSSYVPNGVNQELFYPAKPLVDSVGSSVLFFYDVQSWKGAAEAFGAIMAVAKNFMPNLRLLVVGKYFPIFHQRAKDMIEALIFPMTYFSCPNQKELARIYSSATVFLSSSWYEGFGMPGLEAMACGVPVITTDSGGSREYAIHNQTALVVPPQNPDVLGQSLAQLLADEPLRARLRSHGLQKAKEFDWETTIDMLEQVFQD